MWCTFASFRLRCSIHARAKAAANVQIEAAAWLDKYAAGRPYLFLMAKKIERIGILTAGGDSPGLNAAIRGVGKAALGYYGWEIVGFRDGFRGLVENRRINLDGAALSGILTIGGTILGTSRDKPHRMVMNGRTKDMTGVIRNNLKKRGIDCLVCLGGGALRRTPCASTGQGSM
jgi:hypothetical protein